MKLHRSALFLATIVALPLGAQPSLTLDDFTVAQSGTSSVQDPSLLGGERDVVANGNATFTAGGGLGTAALGTGFTSTFVMLDYDGLDNNPGSVAFLLGNFDVTQGGTMDRFRLHIESVTGTVRTTVRMAENLVTVADFTERFVDISSAGTFDILFSSFAAAANVDITSVERIFLRFNLDAGESISIREFALAGSGTGPAPVPEPAAAALLALGMLALGARARRFRAG